jgi:CheY-like chemotaxis protein
MAKTEFDLVFTDVHMPEMEGPALLQAMRQSKIPWQEKVPVVALTGSMHLEDTTLEMCAGFSETLAKPVAPEVLIRKAVLYTEGIQMAEAIQPQTESLPHAFAYLSSVAGGDRQFMAELIEVFIQETPEAMHGMRIALEMEDRKSMAAQAHRYKANLRYVGLQKAQKLTEKIEQWALAGKWQEIFPALEQVQNEAIQALPELGNWVEILRKTPNIE